MNLLIREITAADESAVLFIRNEPENYKWFFHETTISPEEHAIWFKQRASRLSKLTLVAEEDSEVIGIAYLTEFDSNKAGISISIQPKSVGKGAGTLLLQELMIRSKDLNFTSIFAEIKSSNSQSIGFFTKNGFARNSSEIRIYGNQQIDVITLSLQL
jgi:L-amino acid N-acyltransferase YncA